MGRRAKSPADKRAAGTYRPDRQRRAPVDPGECPAPPKRLAPGGRKFWAELAPVLHRRGVLNSAGVHALWRMCSLYARIEKYEATIEAEGHTVPGVNHVRVRHPLLPPLASAHGEVRALERLFRVAEFIEEPKPQSNAMDDFLNGPKKDTTAKVVPIR